MFSSVRDLVRIVFLLLGAALTINGQSNGGWTILSADQSAYDIQYRRDRTVGSLQTM